MAASLSENAGAIELDGFIEPSKMLAIASTDVSTITEILVKPGQEVAAEEALVKLDTGVLEAALATAEVRRKARGREQAAAAAVRLQQSHLERLRPLLLAGHAQATEIAKIEADLEIANANQLAAREDRLAANSEYSRISAEIERRTIRSPLRATVIELHKDLGEAVIPANPTIMTVAVLKPLKITLAVPTAAITNLRVDAAITARCGEPARAVQTQVDYIAPITDPQTGTVTVELLIENEHSEYRAGLHCLVEL